MNNSKAIFLDLFGTLIEDHGFFEKVADINFKKGALEFLKKVQSAGFIIIISIFREDDDVPEMKYIKSLQNKILKVLVEHGLSKNSVHFLSHVDSEQPDLHPLTPVFIRSLEKKYKLPHSPYSIYYFLASPLYPLSYHLPTLPLHNLWGHALSSIPT